MEPVQNSPSGETASVAPSTSVNVSLRRRTRKAPDEYSTNPNTVRVRQRNAKLTPYRRDVERAKGNDLKAVSSAWKERVKSETYEAASEHMKKKILEEVEQQVMERRRLKGIDAGSKIAALNLKYKPDHPVTVPNPGPAANKRAIPLPKLAPPGYVPFPTPMIPELMNLSPSQSAPSTPVSAFAPVPAPVSTPVSSPMSSPISTPTSTLVGDETVQSISEALAGPVANGISPEISAMIETLQVQYDTEKRQRQEDNTRHEMEIKQLWAAVARMQAQLPQMVDPLGRPLGKPVSTYTFPPVRPMSPMPQPPVHTAAFDPINRFMPIRTAKPAQQFSYYGGNDIDDDGHIVGDMEDM
ncbi:hypothetical protein GQX73_g6547 [Xylaria multiplex]|uniref:Uncharacterized protein n=1 Tax=Xylaria multiplex TaxID=323545 RepID=A0A7C8IZ28_9PEZI|nr:hypothetical protein GQX73_g6547 [Xylaria multiplex]